MDKDIKKKLTRNWFVNLQEMICNTIQQIEGGKIKFLKKSWKRSIKKDEGGGYYYILENGKVFDKVGVNFSEVYGKLSDEFKKKIPGTKNNRDFWASGVSVVMHMKILMYRLCILIPDIFIQITAGLEEGWMLLHALMIQLLKNYYLKD